MQAYPIIVIHNGNQEYLNICLKQAKFSNPSSRIILLGDSKAEKIAKKNDFVEFYRVCDYFNDASEFAKYYKHFSVNLYKFELFCIQRWFVINEFIRKNNIDNFIHLDSDVLLYTDFEKENAKNALNEFDMTITSISGHTSFFNNQAALQKFCDFVLDLYKNNNEFFEQFAKNPNDTNIHYNNLSCIKPLSDMPLLYFFANSGLVKSCDLSATRLNNCIIDDNLSFTNGYVALKAIKQVVFDSNAFPYFITDNGSALSLVRACSIHCQGAAKILMPDYCTYNKDKNVPITLNSQAAIEYAYHIRLQGKKKRNFRRILSNTIELFIPSKKLRSKVRSTILNNYY